MEHFGNSSEYNAFWVKFAKNIEEVRQEYNKLSPRDKQKADMEARNILNIIMTQGFWGLWNYLQNVR